MVPFVGKGGALAKAISETLTYGGGGAYIAHQLGVHIREWLNIKEQENQSQNSENSDVINEIVDALKQKEE